MPTCLVDKWLEQLSALSDELDDKLADTDKKHKEEVLDILELAKQRLEMYATEYGLKEDI